jgi:ubiquinone/menaquinone biosynthesis C-methylase UbiE
MRVSARDGHRLWAEVYDSGPNPVVALERRSMAGVLKPLQTGTTVDVACGTGRWLLSLQQAGSDVFGCDACEEMLSAAQKISPLRGRVALADAEQIPFRGSIADLVLCSLSLGYFHNLDRVFSEFARASKPGGFIAVSDLHPRALASGWTRSFKLGDKLYEVEHHRRAVQEVRSAASSAGLRLAFFTEPRFGAAEFEFFQRAGKGELFQTLLSTPALFIGLWKKSC